MKEWVLGLSEDYEKGEIFLISSTESISNFLENLKIKFRSYKNLSQKIGIDESSIRRWKRNNQIPLSLVTKFKDVGDVKEIIKNLEYVTTKSSPNKVKIPVLDAEIAYIVGYISGDGHLREPEKHKDHWEIIVESWTDESRLDFINLVMREKFNISGVKIANKKRRGWRLFINSKIFHKILTKIFEIPIGKKFDKIIIPEVIQNADCEIKKKYIQGWFDAEGFVTSSKNKLQIEFYVKNANVTEWIKNELQKLKIRVYENRRGTLIIRSSQIRTFNSLIGFQHRKQLSKLAVSTVSGNTRAPSGIHDYWV